MFMHPAGGKSFEIWEGVKGGIVTQNKMRNRKQTVTLNSDTSHILSILYNTGIP